MPRICSPQNAGGIWKIVVALSVFTFLSTFPVDILLAQMESTVNSLADDLSAHPYDDPDTPEDESVDGICGDFQGRCTLRAALEEAANIGTSAYIVFSTLGTIPVDPLQGPFYPPDDSRIQGINQQVSFLGDGMNTPVLFEVGNGTLITGLQLVNALIGIEVYGTHNRIGYDDPSLANYISDMTQNGILITGDSNTITGNVIGLDLLGMPEGSPFGIFITGKENVIGGDRDGEGNIISGNNKGIGVYTVDSLGNNYVVGNFIGTDLTGTQARGNQVGIDIVGPNVTIGGIDVMHRNVISGNTESGVLTGVQASSIFIVENNIGTDNTGTLMIPNRDGITLGPGANNCVVQSNLIAGNTQSGILLSGLPDSSLTSRDHIILDNTITGNGTAGIVLSGLSTDNVIGSSLLDSYAPNQIHDNGQAGVLVGGGVGNPQRNTIRENIFHDNTSYGIRILSGQGGIRPPALESYTDDGQGTATIVGTHPLAGALIDLYAGDSNQSLRQEGGQWLGSGPVDASGFFSIAISSCLCDSIVATATDPLGNTSEFSGGWGPTTSVRDLSTQGTHASAFPNPFRTSATITFELQQTDDILLQICDVTGKLVQTLAHGQMEPGVHNFRWNPASEPAGMYYYRLSGATTGAATGKLVLMW